MSELDEEASKKRPREEEKEEQGDAAVAASSEPPLKQSKGETAATAEDPAETPTESKVIPQQGETTNNVTDPVTIATQETQTTESTVSLSEHKSDSGNGPRDDSDNNVSATLAPDTSPEAQDTLVPPPQDQKETETKEDTLLDGKQQGEPVTDMSGTNSEDQGDTTTTTTTSQPTQEETKEQAAVEEAKTSLPPRPTDPVAEAAAQAEEVATAAAAAVAAVPQASEVVAGMTAATAPAVAPPAVQPGIEAAPDKLAAPPEAVVPDLEDQVVEEKGEISAVIAGRVIGKGGEVIRDLQARSGASIDVDAAPSGTHRIVTYRGPRRKVDFAKSLVDMISRGISDADLPLGEATREVLIIPASATGKVIGRGGEMVREMQTRSQAKIDFDHAATANRPDQKQIIVTGTYDAVRKANEMIMFLVANPQVEAMQALNLLVNEKLASGQPWGSGPPYPSLPNAGSNMQPEMLGSYGSPGGYGPNAQYATAPPSHSSYGRPPDPRFGGAPGMGEDLFYAKKQFMGRIIGQRGITINDLQKRSGADIQINQDVPPGAECEIRIRGTRDAIEMVKQMLREIIEIGPGHPYAGGAGAPGSQGGHYGGGYGAAPYQGGGGGYDYGGQAQSYAYPSQQQSQGSYGYPSQTPTVGGYGGTPAGGPQYQNYGGYGSGGYGGAPAPYGGGAPPSYSSGGGYQSQSSSYQSGYNQQQGGGYQPPQSSGPAQQGYGAAGAYGQAPPSGYPPAPAAAAGWKAATSPDGQTYYYNESTGATQWDKPPGFALFFGRS